MVAGLVVGGVYGLSRLKTGLKAPVGIFDATPPTIAWLDVPKGFGADARAVGIRISDSDSGLERVTVTVVQGERRSVLLDKRYDHDVVLSDDLAVRVDPSALSLAEGAVDLLVSTEDRGMWSSPAELSISRPVDFRRGRIEPLTVQHNATVGGAEVAVFRFVGPNLERIGVEVGGRFFKAFPLKAFSPSGTTPDGLYVALFPIPTNFDPKTETVKLVAVDEFGTQVTSSLYHRIAAKTFPEVDMKLGDQFVHSKVPELLASLRRARPDVTVSGDDVRDFKLVNETLRTLNEATIQKALQESPVTERLWSGAFVRPLAAAPKAGFSESRVYRYEGTEVSRSVHVGIDLADLQQARVGAAQAGEVIFVGDLGIYGETVIVDHGIGVSSLYGHLSSISVKKGERVVIGQELGRTGTSGLAGGDHLHYEVRVQGVPVSPLAWWDPNWMRDHIEGKVTEAEKLLAASTTPPRGENQ
jgi:hypothetical protein